MPQLDVTVKRDITFASLDRTVHTAGMSVIDRRQLGSMLRQARQARRLTIQQVVELLDQQNVQISPSALTQWEQGKRAPRPQDLTPLIAVLEIGEDDTNVIYLLARNARQRNWWSASAGNLRTSFTQLIGLEADATEIGEFSSTIVPGLLQTRDYATAILDAVSPPLNAEAIDTQIEVRLRRQQRLFGEDSRLELLHVVLDQGCIRRQVGGPDVWRDQLLHLIKLATERRIIVQVVPFTVGAHAGTLGGFTLLSFTDARPIAFIELAGSDIYFEGEQADRYRLRFIKLREQALPEPLSLKLIQSVADGKE